jgi:hypothetical protein
MCLPDTRPNFNDRIPLPDSFLSLGIQIPSKNSLHVAGTQGVATGDLSFPRMVSGVLPSLEIPKDTEER